MYIGECWSIIMTRSRYRRQADILSRFQGVSWSSTRRALTGLCGQTVDAFGNLLYQNKEWWLCTIFLLCLVCKRAHNTPMDLTKIDSGSELQGYPAWIGILGQTTATLALVLVTSCSFLRWFLQTEIQSPNPVIWCFCHVNCPIAVKPTYKAIVKCDGKPSR